jgi:hypothetical protein
MCCALCISFQGYHDVTDRTESKVSKSGLTPYDVHSEFLLLSATETNGTYRHASRQSSLGEGLHHSENKQKPYYWPWGSSVSIIPDNVNVAQNYELNCEKIYILLVY